MQMVVGYDPSGPMQTLDVVSSKTGWSEFTLADDTVIRLKGVLIDAKKAVGQYAPDGKPVYILQMTLVNDLQVPENLMKPKS